MGVSKWKPRANFFVEGTNSPSNERPVAGNNNPKPGLNLQQSTAYFRENHVTRKYKGTEHVLIRGDDAFGTRYFEGNEHSVSTPADVDRKGKHIIHNHPGTFGGTLSFTDVKTMCRAGEASVTACAREGDYVMSRGKNAKPKEFVAQMEKDEPMVRKEMELAAYRAYWQGHDHKYCVAKQMEVAHNYWKKTASKYGFTYKSSRDKKYRIDSRVSAQRAEKAVANTTPEEIRRITNIRNTLNGKESGRRGSATVSGTQKMMKSDLKKTQKARKNGQRYATTRKGNK